ncbi:MAG: hypothetical protein QXF12_07095 [Candidatus Aenigmatarchaeota archaeon]
MIKSVSVCPLTNIVVFTDRDIVFEHYSRMGIFCVLIDDVYFNTSEFEIVDLVFSLVNNNADMVIVDIDEAKLPDFLGYIYTYVKVDRISEKLFEYAKE